MRGTATNFIFDVDARAPSYHLASIQVYFPSSLVGNHTHLLKYKIISPRNYSLDAAMAECLRVLTKILDASVITIYAAQLLEIIPASIRSSDWPELKVSISDTCVKPKTSHRIFRSPFAGYTIELYWRHLDTYWNRYTACFRSWTILSCSHPWFRASMKELYGRQRSIPLRSELMNLLTRAMHYPSDRKRGVVWYLMTTRLPLNQIRSLWVWKPRLLLKGNSALPSSKYYLTRLRTSAATNPASSGPLSPASAPSYLPVQSIPPSVLLNA